MAAGIVRCLCPLSSCSCYLLSQSRLLGLSEVSHCSCLQGAQAQGSLTRSGLQKMYLAFPACQAPLENKHTQHIENNIKSRIYNSSSMKLLVISNDQWDFVEMSAKVLAFSACRSSHAVQFKLICPVEHQSRAQCLHFPLQSTISQLQHKKGNIWLGIQLMQYLPSLQRYKNV